LPLQDKSKFKLNLTNNIEALFVTKPKIDKRICRERCFIVKSDLKGFK
jgi:hypothetical protein